MLRKAAESRDKVEEGFLACNTAVQGTFLLCWQLARALLQRQCHYGVKSLIMLLQNLSASPVLPERLHFLSGLSWATSYKQPTGSKVGLFNCDPSTPMFPEILSILIAFYCWGHLLARAQLTRLLILPNL